MLAAILGAGPVADAFIGAFRLPNHFRAIFAEGAFNAAFIPAYARIRTQNGSAQAGIAIRSAMLSTSTGSVSVLLFHFGGDSASRADSSWVMWHSVTENNLIRNPGGATLGACNKA